MFMAGEGAIQTKNNVLISANGWYVFAIAIVIASVLQLPNPLNHDAAWHFQTAFKWLDGARVGYDVFDINPPMTMWLSSIPAIYSNLTGADPQIVFKAFVLLILGGIYLFCEFISSSFDWSAQHRMWFRIFLALGLFVIPAYDFGQREHLVAALITPYILVSALRATGKKVGIGTAIACGLIAGIGFGIKPYFIAVGASLEIALLFYVRHIRQFFRPEIITVLLVVCSYLIAIYIFTPGYYSEVIPAALSNYGGYSSPWNMVWQRLFATLAFGISVLIIVFLVCKARVRHHAVVVLLLAAGFGFFIAVLGQQKAWAYQIIPVSFFVLIALSLMIADMYHSSEVKRVAPFVALFVAAVFIYKPMVPFVSEMMSPTSTKARIDRLSEIFKKNAGEDGLVFAFITSPRDIHPAILQSGTKWAGAAGAMVYLPAYLGQSNKNQNSQTAIRIRETAEKYDREMIAGLIKNPPGVIVSQFGFGRLGLENNPVSYPLYFSRYPEFVDFWKQYQSSETVGNFEVYLKSR
ncbi:MAG: hypothetical protein L3J32_07815 [Rhizobiaceae bacterium]|nr:hypothetical protein [Rhizobiaceae bacterium]